MARLKAAGHSEVAKTEERMTLLVFCITHIVLSEILHVMHIHTHVVAETVRHEEA